MQRITVNSRIAVLSTGAASFDRLSERGIHTGDGSPTAHSGVFTLLYVQSLDSRLKVMS
eukprot:jgi/Botrbrau1/15717/Bobra.4_1s0087.1